METRINEYCTYLIANEKCEATIKKYKSDILKYFQFIEENEYCISKESVLLFKQHLLGRYAVSSCNSILIALNGYLGFVRLKDFCVKTYKLQRNIFMEDAKNFEKEDYQKLVKKATMLKDYRMGAMFYTFATTGIRVSELKYITCESLKEGKVQINSKGKVRIIILTNSLIKRLTKYCKDEQIASGSIFITRSGRNIDRSNIWRAMKKIAKLADVLSSKVFPHNFRHLFAKIYYSREKDLVRLADFLGHTSLETTRLYTITGKISECRMQLNEIFTSEI